MSPELESKHMCPNCARRLENVQTKHKTVMLFDELTIDQGLGNDLFTERQLVKE